MTPFKFIAPLGGGSHRKLLVIRVGITSWNFLASRSNRDVISLSTFPTKSCTNSRYQSVLTLLDSTLPIDLSPLLHKLHRLHFHPLLQRFVFADALLRGEVAHVLGDLHGAEVGAAHGAEVGDLGGFLGQGFVVEALGFVGVEAEVELVGPAEFEAGL